MKKAFFVEIHPTPTQKQKIHQTIGTCRYVYNLYLQQVKQQYEQDGTFLSGFDFSKWLNNTHTKQTDCWIKEVSSKAVKQSIMNGEKAFKNFFNGLTKYPQFKKKKNQSVKAYFPKNNKTDWIAERHRIKIPTIGWMRLKEYGYIPVDAVVKSGTVSFKAGRYYVSVLCEIPPKETTLTSLSNKGLGIDLGLKDFAICSNDFVAKNINKTKEVKKLKKKLTREQRSLSRKYEILKKRGDNSAAKRANINKNILHIQKIHQRLANIRKEYVKSVVSTIVKAKPSFITIEDLNVKGMMKNRHLAKAVAEQNFYYFTLWLLQKCKEYGIELRQVNRFYPSSKLCSCCGHKKQRLSLAERTYHCENCGLVIDRDKNAALNLEKAKEYKVLT